VDGQRLGREQLLDVCYLIVLAGLDTVGSAMACILARLAREPALRQRLVAEPRLWAPAVEELLRFESPVQHGFRTPSQDLEIAGEVIPAGTTFFLSWAAANLDPAAFKNPLSIDLERQPNPHLAFGSGPHRCLGIYLARMELRAALEQLHRRIPEYSLRPGHELVFSGKPRTVNGLPLIWS
jgi:cytochrome P450